MQNECLLFCIYEAFLERAKHCSMLSIVFSSSLSSVVYCLLVQEKLQISAKRHKRVVTKCHICSEVSCEWNCTRFDMEICFTDLTKCGMGGGAESFKRFRCCRGQKLPFSVEKSRC